MYLVRVVFIRPNFSDNFSRFGFDIGGLCKFESQTYCDN